MSNIELILLKEKLELQLLKSKKLTYKLIFIFLLVVTGVIGFFLIQNSIQKKDIQSKEVRISLLNSKINGLDGVINTYKDKNGELYSQIEVLEGSVSSLKDNLDLLDIEKKELKQKVGSLSNLLSITKIELQKVGQGETNVDWNKDSTENNTEEKAPINSGAFSWNDDFLYINGRLLSDSVYLRYETVPLKLKIIPYEKNPLFGRATTVMDIYTEPNVRIISAQTYTVTHKEPFYEVWWVDLIAGFAAGAWLFSR